MNELKIGKDSSIIDIINYILTVDPYIPIEQLDNSKQTQILYELLDRDDINSEVRKKALLVIWRDSNTEIRKNCTPDVFNKIIEAMKGDAKRLSAIWRVTPESIQLQNESSLTEIMQYSIEDTNRYIDIWKNTAEELKQKHPEIARKIDILEQLETKNSKIYSTINLRILDEKYLSSLDFEQLQAITNYPQEQKRILDLTDNQYHVLIKTLRGIDSLEQWKYEFELVMSNLDGYEDLINSISKMPEENIDFYEVLNVLQQKNYFNIRDYQEIAELDQRKERLYQAAKKGEETPGYDKQFILLEYLFNIDKGQAENLTKKYAQDLPNLENNQENDELKQIISQIQTVLNCNDERSDTRTFNNSKFQRVKFDSIKLEQKLKKAYANEYNATLTQLNDMQPVEEQLQDRFDLQAYKVYDAGTDFNILMTSIAPYNSNFPKNYCEDWNRQENISQGFCCSYIRNDMLGHAPVPHVCYGFSNMDAKSLIISSVDDMGSNMSNGLVEKVAYDNVRFYSPNHQINAVYDESGYGFNEMVYSRMQNGKKKQPDYTIAFMKNGNIPNIDTIKQVVEQFKEQGIDLPIVIIDEDRCIQSEKMTLDSMIQDFEENPNQESYDKIQQRVKNNCVANNFEFQEYMNFILNSYEHMTEIMKRRTSQEAEEQISGWMEKCKSWYEYPKHLQGKVKDNFLGIKKNIVQFIKSRLTEKQKNKGNSIKEEERDK